MAAIDITGSFISISENDKTSSKSSIQQLVDIVQADIASIDSTTRKKYEVFVSGGLGLENISSSLFQTVYDQDFTLGTSNALFDISIGSLQEEGTSENQAVVNGVTSTLDAGGKLTSFPATVTMMREKVNIYKQFASVLLGNPNAAFVTPHSNAEDPPATPNADPAIAATEPKYIKGAVFICFKRLFTRDNIFKGSFGMRIHKKAALLYQDFLSDDSRATGTSLHNIDLQADINETNDSEVYSDSIVTTNLSVDAVGGEVSTIVNSSGQPVGVIFYDKGVIVLDIERAFDSDQIIRGLISSTRRNNVDNSDHVATRFGPFYVYGQNDGTEAVHSGSDRTGYYYPVYTQSVGSSNTAMTSASFTIIDENDNPIALGGNSLFIDTTDPDASLGQAEKPGPLDSGERYPLYVPGSSDDYYSNTVINDFTDGGGSTLLNDKLYPGLWTSGTIDEVVDHICTTRFGRGNSSAVSFRNETVINSSLIFCRAAPTQFNYSTNPTYSTADGHIIKQDFIRDGNSPFSYVTTVGLYDANRQLLAVAKTSRPIEKNPQTDLSIRVRLDY